MRGKRENTKSIGIMRIDITDSCKSRVLRVSWEMPLISFSCSPGRRVRSLLRFLAGGFLFLFLGRLRRFRRRILDAGLGADHFQRLEEPVAARVVAGPGRIGADFVERLEEAIAFAIARGRRGGGGRRRRGGGAASGQRVEEAITHLRFLALALGVLARGLGRAQGRQLLDLHLVGIDHEGADGHDIVQRFVGGDDHRMALGIERHQFHIAHQAQFGRQRFHFPVHHGRQLQAVALAAAMVDRLHFGRVEGRRHRRHRFDVHVLRQLLQHHAHVAHRFLVDGRAEAVPVQLHLQDILGRQEGVDMGRRQRHFALADAVQQRFQHVRDFAHVGHAKRRRAALDRMGGAENRVQVFFAGRLDVHSQQQALHFSQQLFRLVEEDLVELANIDGHATPLN
jgi:hypothetical protein